MNEFEKGQTTDFFLRKNVEEIIPPCPSFSSLLDLKNMA